MKPFYEVGNKTRDRVWELMVKSKFGIDVYNMITSMPDHQYLEKKGD